jgi:two-component system nitrogen regulation sensor histidine kinase NtrY
MPLFEKLTSVRINKSRFQDIIFLIGIFLFSALLILGLFPKDIDIKTGKSFFLYYMMTIPIIAAVYFIVISFRRKLYSEPSEIGSSIRIKIAIAFVFVAVLPSLPIILISNNIINKTLAELISEKTSHSLEESIAMSTESISDSHSGMQSELKSLDYLLRKGVVDIRSRRSRELIKSMFALRGYNLLIYRVLNSAPFDNSIVTIDGSRKVNSYENSIEKFLAAVNLKENNKIYNLFVGKDTVLLGRLNSGGYLIAIFKKIPEKIFNRITIYEDALRRYKQTEFLKPYFQTGVGIFLLLLSILIILISVAVSVFLSRSITKPVLDLADAAKSVASGNFDIKLERSSPDELSLLFQSFNEMVTQLNESREILYQTQKLEAWREMARKLVHEIKNPLTPIKLSAERIRKRYSEGHPEIDNIVMTGSETIIEGVNILMRILSEFSKFARLPDMKPEYKSLNPVIENCINFFHGHEGVTFHLELDSNVPDTYFDKMLLRQALTNIIQNAIDAIESNGNIYVQSELVQDGNDFIRISIKDDGAGIGEEDRGKIFEPTFSTKEKGTGLGLTIVEKIILEHHGKIYLNSTPGKGSEFIVELPVIQEGVFRDGEDTHS